MTDILISTYNGEHFLKEQLDSLLSQSYKDFKIIVRDDCSTDKTMEILQEYIAQSPSKFLLIENKNLNLGSSNSFFELLKQSSGDIVFFCDQDDVWNTDKLEKMIDFYNKNCSEKAKSALFHSSAEVVDENLCPMPIETQCFNKSKCGMEKGLVSQLFKNDVTGCTVMINAAMRDALSPIDFANHNVIQHDWFLAFIAFCNKSKFFFPEMTIKYRQHQSNVISAKKMTLKKRLDYKIRHGILYPFYEFVECALQVESVQKSDFAGVLSEFAGLKKKSKFYRIYWHLRHKFFREENLLYKLYQLAIC